VSGIRPLRLVGAVVALGALVALGVVAASVVDGGGRGTANGSVPVDGLDDLTGSWLAVNDTTTPAPVQGTVRLVFEGGQVVAQTGCNTASGVVAVEDSVLVADALATTRMACEPALMEQERWVLEMLTSRPRLELSGPFLALHWGDGEGEGEGERWWLGLEQEAPESVPAS
jgi:heat shock protein HslJ